MLSRMHQKLGTAGLVVAVVALVVALTGAAFAAGGLTKQQEKQVKKIAKKFAGKNGKQGPKGDAGPAGPQGPKGDAGAAGKDGANGTNGTNGTNGEDGMCTAGNPTCQLPSGATLVGAWGTSGGKGVAGVNPSVTTNPDISLVPISFVQQVSPEPTALWELEFGAKPIGVLLKDGGAEIYDPTAAEEPEAWEEAWENSCPGNADQPAAAPGFLCIYNTALHEVFTPFEMREEFPELYEAANEYGFTFPFKMENGAYAKGSWAVTAE